MRAPPLPSFFLYFCSQRVFSLSLSFSRFGGFLLKNNIRLVLAELDGVFMRRNGRKRREPTGEPIGIDFPLRRASAASQMPAAPLVGRHRCISFLLGCFPWPGLSSPSFSSVRYGRFCNCLALPSFYLVFFLCLVGLCVCFDGKRRAVNKGTARRRLQLFVGRRVVEPTPPPPSSSS